MRPRKPRFDSIVRVCVLAEDAIDIYRPGPARPGAPRQDFALARYNCREGLGIELFADGFEGAL